VTAAKWPMPERIRADDPTVEVLVGPSMRGGALENGESRKSHPAT